MTLVHNVDQLEGLHARINDLEARLQEKEYQLTQERETSKLQLRTITDNLPIILFGIDKNGILTMSEGKGLAKLGLKPGQAVGMDAFEMYKDHPEIVSNLHDALNGKSYTFTQSLGDVKLQTWFNPANNEDGLQNSVLGLSIDISDRVQTELELQESRNLLQLVLDAIPVRVFWKDTNSVYLGSNKLFAQDAKVKSSKQLIGKTDADFYPNEAEAYRLDDQKVMASGKSKLNFEELQTTPDGLPMWLRTSKIPLRNVAGEIVGVLGTYDDITERRQADIELRESKNRLELAFQAANLASWDWNMITNDTIYDAGFNRMLGYEPGTLGNDLTGFSDNLHPDDMQRTFKAVADYAEGRAPKYDTEFRMKHKDGSWRWVAATGQVVERQADGKTVRMIGVNQDITARKQAELELQQSKNNLEMAMDIAQLGSWDANLITNKTLFDARYEKMLGFAPGELAGENPTHVSEIHPDDLPKVLEVVMDYITGKVPDYVIEFRTRTKDRRWKWVYAKALLIERMADGTPLRLAGVNQDITARKEAEQEREVLLNNEREARREAQEALRMKDLFLATMSHELRTPLNAMIGFQHLMLFSEQLNADNAHMAERSIANSQRLLNLINNILDISRIATGGLKIVPVTMSARQLANNIGTDLNLQAKEKGLTLTIDVAADVPEIITHDEERMGQIMLNLVGNALKFTDKGGTVTLSVRKNAERLIMEVKDTGIGIPASQKHVIFDDFVQLDNSSTRKHQGAGLGLAIVKRLALLMQGSITVESEIGQGSTFVVTLPLNLNPEMYQ